MEKQSFPLHAGKSFSVRFDPFNNRLARDIRNTLAETFVDSLQLVDKSGYQQTAEQWLVKNLTVEYSTYVQDRLIRYDHAFSQFEKNRIKDAKLQALVLWNHGLFFEVHEHLERIWQKTAGDEYQALKGLIQAAGVYIHLKYNHRAAAEKLAIKSSDRIQKYADCLAFIANLNMLLEKLKNLDPAPPQLMNPTLKMQ